MKIGYARVSTVDQILDLQIDALTEAGCEKIFQEKISRTKDDRPELNKMLEQLRSGDTLVVYKLDRLGWSTRKLIELVDELEQGGVEFVSIRDSIDTTTAVGKAMFRMLAVLAEMERGLIAERTKETKVENQPELPQKEPQELISFPADRNRFKWISLVILIPLVISLIPVVFEKFIVDPVVNPLKKVVEVPAEQLLKDLSGPEQVKKMIQLFKQGHLPESPCTFSSEYTPKKVAETCGQDFKEQVGTDNSNVKFMIYQYSDGKKLYFQFDDNSDLFAVIVHAAPSFKMTKEMIEKELGPLFYDGDVYLAKKGNRKTLLGFRFDEHGKVANVSFFYRIPLPRMINHVPSERSLEGLTEEQQIQRVKELFAKLQLPEAGCELKKGYTYYQIKEACGYNSREYGDWGNTDGRSYNYPDGKILSVILQGNEGFLSGMWVSNAPSFNMTKQGIEKEFGSLYQTTDGYAYPHPDNPPPYLLFHFDKKGKMTQMGLRFIRIY
ncbi:recombinase family protein [Shimazuella kribbensis]|uniref:recombinase family protein n=1 Tax=Shimazuella kribbensis TaxID=139808 RepID=UPI0003F9A0F4